MYCFHGKDPEISLLRKGTPGFLWSCKPPSWRSVTALKFTLRDKKR